ncbi:MAG TPA: bifunctional phosphoribosylaminoimidazolecarboxamide formyltransferase/IMP cyclohydrolase PurH, partial [Clostridiales bacterium]|nr:bifunctional phosphoribosylaminoimidazolecarboxamide formyltransferase/IMP cyclohydrolase PurH [Clostridiales bacterium]
VPSHMAELERHGIVPVDLVAVNLYPFQETVNRHAEARAAGPSEAELAEAVENIDIGGPTLIRSAAKNHDAVIVVTDPAQYGTVLEHLQAAGDVPRHIRRELAVAAFRHTAFYDAVISEYLSGVVGERDVVGKLAGDGPEPAGGGEERPAKTANSRSPFGDRLVLAYEKVRDLRYGENPHQRAAFYRHPLRRVLAGLGATLAGAVQLQGKDLSYNNIADAEAALRAVEELDEGPTGPAAAVAVKHMNPCGAAVAEDILTAYRLARDSDPVSIFGGIVALTRPVDAELAREMVKIFLEVVMAPEFTPEALEVFKAKPGIRLLALPVGGGPSGGGLPAPACGASAAEPALSAPAFLEARTVAGGLLVQTADVIRVPPSEWKTVTRRAPTPEELRDLTFAWKVCKHVKSNAVVVARGGQLLGVGAGQMNRVDAVRLAVGHAERFAAPAAGGRSDGPGARAGSRPGARGSVLASDAFFPFPDSVEVAAEAGVTAIVQPGGSVKDEEAIRACDKAGMAMVFTGERHFRH